jgi:hypothetical protein
MACETEREVQCEDGADCTGRLLTSTPGNLNLNASPCGSLHKKARIVAS